MVAKILNRYQPKLDTYLQKYINSKVGTPKYLELVIDFIEEMARIDLNTKIKTIKGMEGA